MKPAARSFGFGKALVLFSASVSLLFGVVACADPEGATPTCLQDVGDKSHKNIENGCNPFAVCLDSKGNQVNAEECCKNLTNDYEHQVCLAGYGAAEFPATGTGGSGG